MNVLFFHFIDQGKYVEYTAGKIFTYHTQSIEYLNSYYAIG